LFYALDFIEKPFGLEELTEACRIASFTAVSLGNNYNKR
jgi:FixJ family two-component response regulator